jgi:hypothetical protein
MEDTPLDKKYRASADAGFEHAVAGKPVDSYSEECKSGRFAYAVGYAEGKYKRLAETVYELSDEEKVRKFFLER